jgi:DNA-directed RNA polymerase subunit RPC12/RpoP
MIPISDGKVPLVVLDRQLVDRNGKCPYCGGRIIIVPTSPSGDRIVTYGTERRALNDHFYAYCPTPDTKGEMPFRFDGITTFLNDSEVSWFFSKRLETLTDRELEMENAYRVRVGKEAVRKRDTHY